MFIHNFKNSLKTLFKDRMLIFWTFLFPIILGTLFNLAFKDIENNEKLHVIDIAVVNENDIFKSVFDSLSANGSDKLFNVKYVNLEEAKELLSLGEITGYVVVLDEPKVVVSSNGINETVLKFVVDEVLEYQNMISNLVDLEISNDGSVDLNYLINKMYQDVREKMNEDVNIVDISSKNLSYTMIEFYTLIAMYCLYGGIFAIVSINNSLANMSSKGARVAVSPISKFTLIFSSLFASYIVQLVGLFILFMFTIFVLNVDYGSDFWLVVLTSLVGSLTGLSTGIFVGSIFKVNENTKTGILMAFTMAGCFLSGMMGITMKYMIDSNVPLLNKINPAAMITDAFYSLYYFTTRDRFWFDILSLLVFSLILIGVSTISLRRQRYDSI